MKWVLFMFRDGISVMNERGKLMVVLKNQYLENMNEQIKGWMKLAIDKKIEMG